MTKVKICGTTSLADARAAADAGARYVGMNFFPPSPRCIGLDRAAEIAAALPSSLTKVAVTVDADDALIDALAALGADMIQMHGGEPPERVAAVHRRTGLPVMKALGVRDADDVAVILRYEDVADQLLIDAKPPKDAVLPGGNGAAFDWSLLAGRAWRKPWLLAGGLNAANVSDAIAQTGAAQIDAVSGVEAEPGRMDHAKIRAFIAAAG
ncbi:MAG: phosphoribosylanthranilate isomerase [Pseudomonadota bacterium]